MNSSNQFTPDHDRFSRINLDEAVFCEFKSIEQIQYIISEAIREGRRQLLTRLSRCDFDSLSESVRSAVDYDELSRTAILGGTSPSDNGFNVAVVTAGTSDTPVAMEAVRTLAYHGVGVTEYSDIGVAGLWRVLNVKEQLRQASVVIVAAGMDAALPSVIAGLIPSVVIAVPTSVGYGVASGGRAALDAILSSCAPGVTTVNIDNGYGAACAAIRIVGCIINNGQ